MLISNNDTWINFNKNKKKYGLPPLPYEEYVFRAYANLSFAPLLYENHRVTELGIFWMDTSLSKIIHYRTILNLTEKDIVNHYTFDYEKEWASHPESIQGNYNDYPRGRIFYHNQYIVEGSFELTEIVESYLSDFFYLPSEWIFFNDKNLNSSVWK